MMLQNEAEHVFLSQARSNGRSRPIISWILEPLCSFRLARGQSRANFGKYYEDLRQSFTVDTPSVVSCKVATLTVNQQLACAHHA